MSVNVEPRAAAAERLSRMIQIPTVSAELAERGSAPFERFTLLLEELYPLVHSQLSREQITEFGLLYRWPGVASDTAGSAPSGATTPAGAGPVVLMAHFDVVPAAIEDGWDAPPFSGRISGGYVHGRGALDDKGPLLVMFEAVENLLAAGFTPARDVYLSLGGNEETYGDAAKAIAQVFVERGITPWLVLDEGGAVVAAPLPFVRGEAAMIGVAEKGATTVALTAQGAGGHASAPPALTSVGRVAKALARLTPGTFPARTPRAVTSMLAQFSGSARGPARLLYRILAASPWLTAKLFTRLGGEPAALVRTSVAPTMLSGGSAQNVLPSRAEAIVNLRIALGESVAGTVRRIRRRVADRHVQVEVLEGGEPSPESPTDNDQFALICAAVGASHPAAAAVPYVMMAATDSRYFHTFTPACYRFAPLAMPGELRASIHGINERVAISELARGELFHRTLIEGIPAHTETSTDAVPQARPSTQTGNAA